jgi:acetyl esterase/lipase
MPVHPQVQQVRDIAAQSGAKPIGEATVVEAREGAWGWLTCAGSGEPVARVVDRFIPGPSADLPIRIYTPAGAGPFPAILAFHGSGWVIANIDLGRRAASRARQSQRLRCGSSQLSEGAGTQVPDRAQRLRGRRPVGGEERGLARR